MDKRKAATLAITSLIIVVAAVSAYFIFSSINSSPPAQGEHLTVSLTALDYTPLPGSGSTITLALNLNVTNSGTQNVTITEISILDSNMNPVYNESLDSPLNVGSTAAFAMTLQNYPQYCIARVFTADGHTFDSNTLVN